MIVRAIEIRNFRNISRAALSFSGTFNLITGRNAQGKTNLLEAIHLFSLGRSFRTRRSEEILMFGEDYMFARLSCKSDSSVDFRLEMSLEREGNIKASINGKRISGMSEIIGVIPTVIFTPGDVMLASGPPGGRRTYLDYTAAQVSPAFLSDLKSYRKILKQRNVLLKGYADTGRMSGEIDAWDEQLVEKGAKIVSGRKDMLGETSLVAADMLEEILPGSEPLRMVYECSFDPEGNGTADAFRKALHAVRPGERRRGHTMAGPHYDDVAIYLGKTGLRRYGSQGRKRLVAIVMKLAQAAAIMKRRAERPVVLLDDIFSELDAEASTRVGSLLSDKYQNFITSPGTEVLPRVTTETSGAVLYSVASGVFSSGKELRCGVGVET